MPKLADICIKDTTIIFKKYSLFLNSDVQNFQYFFCSTNGLSHENVRQALLFHSADPFFLILEKKVIQGATKSGNSNINSLILDTAIMDV